MSRIFFKDFAGLHAVIRKAGKSVKKSSAKRRARRREGNLAEPGGPHKGVVDPAARGSSRVDSTSWARIRPLQHKRSHAARAFGVPLRLALGERRATIEQRGCATALLAALLGGRLVDFQAEGIEHHAIILQGPRHTDEAARYVLLHQ